jgi:phosphoribosylformimino-5-aminoimidazole carboxamide ribotide isomerase
MSAMQVIGVVDLLDGRAVHARAGERERYAPVRSRIDSSDAPGSVPALGRLYVAGFGLTDLYVADLDAIFGKRPQDEIVRSLAASFDAKLWLDAGVVSVERARQVLELGAAHVVVGLETLPSLDALAAICTAIGRERVAFSLDLRDGRPMAGPGFPSGEPAHVLASRAAAAGAGAIIVIDLARVGIGAGLDLALIARVREAVPGVTLLAGGGVRGWDDLAALDDAGCDGALVASALIDGRLDPAEVAAAMRRQRSDTR